MMLYSTMLIKNPLISTARPEPFQRRPTGPGRAVEIRVFFVIFQYNIKL